MEGPASIFCWQLCKVATGAASASNRATTGGCLLPNKHYIYPQHGPLATTAEDCAAGELISHSGTANQQRLRLWVPQEINPPWNPLRLGLGTGLWRRVQDRTSSSKHQFTPPIAACFTPVNHFISFPDDFYQFNCR